MGYSPQSHKEQDMIEATQHTAHTEGQEPLFLKRDKICLGHRKLYPFPFVCSVTQSVQLFGTLWTVACQAPLSVGFSLQEYWSGLPLPFLIHFPCSALALPGCLVTEWIMKKREYTLQKQFWGGPCPRGKYRSPLIPVCLTQHQTSLHSSSSGFYNCSQQPSSQNLAVEIQSFKKKGNSMFQTVWWKTALL